MNKRYLILIFFISVWTNFVFPQSPCKVEILEDNFTKKKQKIIDFQNVYKFNESFKIRTVDFSVFEQDKKLYLTAKYRENLNYERLFCLNNSSKILFLLENDTTISLPYVGSFQCTDIDYYGSNLKYHHRLLANYSISPKNKSILSKNKIKQIRIHYSEDSEELILENNSFMLENLPCF